MKMKKLSMLLTLLMVLTAVPAFAAEPAAVATPAAKASDAVTVTVDGTPVTFDQAPIIQDGRALVPMRAIFEALGAYVEWHPATKTISVEKRFDTIKLKVDSSDMWVEDEAIKLDVPAQVVNGRTLVPARAVAEALGADVKWDAEKKLVTITSKTAAHQISDKYIETQIKDADGNVVLNGRAAYPVIANPDKSSVIESLNASFAKTANDYIKSLEGEPAKLAKEEIGQVRDGDDYYAHFYLMSFDVSYDHGTILSVDTDLSSDTNGAHPNSVLTSKVYDLTTGKTLELTDILAGTKTEIEKKVIDGFHTLIEKYPSSYLEGAEKTVEKEISNVNFCLYPTGIAFYYPMMTVAPYSEGYPEFHIPFTETEAYKMKDLAY